MKISVLDVESTIRNKGNPFNQYNKLCMVGLFDGTDYHLYDIEHSDNPYGHSLIDIKQRIESSDLLIGFNIKFDLHWIRRYINDIKFPPVWDCQLGEFIISNQRESYPSLDASCDCLGLGRKSTHINDYYWSRGIDTTGIPYDELCTYLKQDLYLTHELYKARLPLLRNNKVFQLQCRDLLVLQEMEYNGMLFNIKEANEAADKTAALLSVLDQQLMGLFAVDGINFNSSDHISCCLFGGLLSVPATIPTERTLKDGTIKRGTKQGFKTTVMPRLIEPEDRNETKKKGVYSVDQQILRGIKCSGKGKEAINLLLRRSDLDKLLSTYFRGIPKIIEEYEWKKQGDTGEVHGQFNQCVAVTGRLSSSKPNQQNFAEEIKPLFVSQYD